MTYATESDIQNEFRNVTFGADDAVKSAAIGDFLSQADAVIDMYIGKRYVTPATAATSLLVLKKIAIDIVTYRVTKILDLKKSVPVPDNNILQDITEGTAYRESMKILTAIRDNKMDLPGETEINSDSALGSFHTEASSSDIVPVFEKGTVQW